MQSQFQARTQGTWPDGTVVDPFTVDYVILAGGGSGRGGIGGGGGAGGCDTPQVTASAATANTGGGGGGGAGNAPQEGGAGGKGVVIVSMPDANYSGTTTGSPTVATGVSGKTVLTFTGSGSYVS